MTKAVMLAKAEVLEKEVILGKIKAELLVVRILYLCQMRNKSFTSTGG